VPGPSWRARRRDPWRGLDSPTMTATEIESGDTDLGALDVAWNIDALLPAAGDAGVDELLDAATAKATGLEAARGTIATMDAGELATFMHGLEAIAELVGRAGNYVHLAFAV